MDIGLIDVDGHHYPNLALIKLSAWHKAQGDAVDMSCPDFADYADGTKRNKRGE